MAYTTIDNSELYFQAKPYTGNSGTQSITLDGSENMAPDWVWIKSVAQVNNHTIFDSVRGATKRLRSNQTNAENTSSGVTSFDTNGFSVGSDSATSSGTMVSWCWRAGGSASSNSNGSITSSVSAGSTQGFSIVAYQGTGSDANVGHGLSSAPELIITKSRGSTTDWKVHTSAIDGSWDVGTLNSTSAFGNSSYTAPTNSIFYVGSGSPTNASGINYISYHFHSVKGYSLISSYKGNGNDGDGSHIHCGFRPAYILIKSTASSTNYPIIDNKRPGYNPANAPGNVLFANTSSAASSSATRIIDLNSQGFKIRGNNNDLNASGNTFLFYAVAESPFVNSNGVPNNAK